MWTGDLGKSQGYDSDLAPPVDPDAGNPFLAFAWTEASPSVPTKRPTPVPASESCFERGDGHLLVLASPVHDQDAVNDKEGGAGGGTGGKKRKKGGGGGGGGGTKTPKSAHGPKKDVVAPTEGAEFSFDAFRFNGK